MFSKINKAYRWIRYTDLRLKKRSVRFLYQRLTRGWSDEETWSMDGTFARFILPRLIRFKELHNGYPHDLSSKEWDENIQLMIDAFTFYAGEDRFDCMSKQFEDAQVGLELFAKYYKDLWW